VKFDVSTFVPGPLEVVFDLSVDIDAHLSSMARSGETAVDGVVTGLIGMGETVTWRAKHFGITWKMTSKITEWDRPHRFVDEQLRGPFRSFRHVHRFEPRDGGTEMIDEVVYSAPLGPIGATFDRIVLHRYMRRLIEVRNEFIVAEAGRRL